MFAIGWRVGEIARASKKLDRDGFNVMVDNPESSHRHTLRIFDAEGVTVYSADGTQRASWPDGSYLEFELPPCRS